MRLLSTIWTLFVSLFAVVLMCGCKQKKIDNVSAQKDTLTLKSNTVKHIATDTANFEPDYPSSTAKYPARILTASAFHIGEIDSKSEEYQWKGLFKAKDGYYIADTKINLSLFDDIFDDKNGKPIKGLEVTTTIKDSTIILVSGLDLANRPVREVKLGKRELLPGEQEQFSINGVKYILYATGDKKSESSNKDFYTISNYKLFIKAAVNGKTFDQLLVSIPRVTDIIGNISFVGDIDGDDIPDFIIDTAFDENVEITTLYLSGQAEKNDLLKVVGLHFITGC